MDGENNGKPQLKWMISGENPLFSGNIQVNTVAANGVDGKIFLQIPKLRKF